MYIERIKFERTGGFAGIRLTTEIEVNELPDDEKHEIIKLFDEVDFEELPEKLNHKRPMPDEFTYSIVVQSGKREYEVIAGQSALPDDIQPLIEVLERFAKRRTSRK